MPRIKIDSRAPFKRQAQTLTLAEFKRILEFAKNHERDGLLQMPAEIALHEQSGYLIGYADCWKAIKELVEPYLNG